MNAKSLAGQVAIVTGSSGGLGAGIVEELAARGAAVTVNYHSHPDKAEKVLKRIKAAGGKGISVQGDTSKLEDIAHMIDETLKAFSRLDIMIANAGIQVDATALEMTVEQWDKAMSLDLRGQFLCAQQAARQFIKQGIDTSISRAAGKIVCMLSVHDRIPWMGHVNYAAAKGGANMMMQTMAQELAVNGIRVCGISPGAIRTEINRKVWDDKDSYGKLLKLIPYKRMGEVKDVANVASWLVSDEADYITGTTIYVDGGMLLYPGFMGNG